MIKARIAGPGSLTFGHSLVIRISSLVICFVSLLASALKIPVFLDLLAHLAHPLNLPFRLELCPAGVGFINEDWFGLLAAHPGHCLSAPIGRAAAFGPD